MPNQLFPPLSTNSNPAVTKYHRDMTKALASGNPRLIHSILFSTYATLLGKLGNDGVPVAYQGYIAQLQEAHMLAVAHEPEYTHR